MANLHALPVQALRSAPMQKVAQQLKQQVVQQLVAPRFEQNSQSNTKQKWTYVLANTISFSEKADFVITLPKPQTTVLKDWLEKIITSGQCSLLFVEQLSIDEISHRRIQHLCAVYNVTLINLLPNVKAGQVLKGPW
ncbi:hypothetical protein [Paraglaciecola hydrolytica]|uniref:Uncharacterized protein n=1 Tax=Paraglaciecola hydrolytica TaxID=1799789 RepID=A0A136A1F2_9ALTE|nr:hypothetical protein [Paraglaciecola hydrolytica]KXI29017.1 hypothetical protein AX660_12675 [Paraglaciecola hydrolytica]